VTRFLITGAAGFIGSHVADRLLADGHEVVGIDNLSTGRRENVAAAVSFIDGDIANSGQDWWMRDADGVDFIVHCAASYDDRDKWHRDTSTNVAGAINTAILARAMGARVIYFQTALIYGNNPYARFPRMVIRDTETDSVIIDSDQSPSPLPVGLPVAPENSYAISKYAGEQYLRHSGVPLLTFRLANIYGPRNLSGPVPTFWKRITEGDPCTVVDSRRDFVYIDDLVDLVTQAISEEATGTYHVSTGHDYAIGDLYSAVLDALDVSDFDKRQVGLEPVPRGADDAPTILLDPSETLRDFGWQATTDLDEGVERACAWYAEHGVERTFTHLAVKG
jgi:UDP-glucose 4-epimerase